MAQNDQGATRDPIHDDHHHPALVSCSLVSVHADHPIVPFSSYSTPWSEITTKQATSGNTTLTLQSVVVILWSVRREATKAAVWGLLGRAN